MSNETTTGSLVQRLTDEIEALLDGDYSTEAGREHARALVSEVTATGGSRAEGPLLEKQLTCAACGHQRGFHWDYCLTYDCDCASFEYEQAAPPNGVVQETEEDFALEDSRRKSALWHVLHAALQVCRAEAELRRGDPSYADFAAVCDTLPDAIAVLDKEAGQC